MNYLLDSSALLAHAQNEPDAEEVQALIDDETQPLFFSALSLFEIAGVIKNQGAGSKVTLYWQAYGQIATVLPVTADLAVAAWSLREATGLRMPISDAVIAAIPDSVIPPLRLREK